MADVDDRWHKMVDGKKVRTEQYGKGKRWRARWRDEAGTQRQHSFDTKVDAERHVATVQADMLRRTYVDPRAGNVTFRAYAERWRLSQVHETSSQRTIESRLRLYAYPYLGDRQIGAIRRTEAQAWIRKLETGNENHPPLMPNTVDSVYQYVKAIAAAAVADKVIGSSPFNKLKRSRPVAEHVSPPTLDQINALYAAFTPELRAMVAVGSGAGLRLSEAIALEVDSVDFLGRQILVRQQIARDVGRPMCLRLPKGRKTRIVPMAETVAKELSQHLEAFPPAELPILDMTNRSKPVQRTGKFLFVSRNGKVMRDNWFSDQVLRKARTAAGLPDEFTFHDLRHFFASLLIRHGESVKSVQAALGHATAAMTLDVYGHLWPDSEDRTRAAVDAGFKGDVGAMWAKTAEGPR